MDDNRQSEPPTTRRRYPRYEIETELSASILGVERREMRGRSLNINEGGIAGVFATGWDVGASVNLQFSVPIATTPVRVRGVVRNRTGYASDWTAPTFREGELEGWEKWSTDMPQREWARVHLHHSIMGEDDFVRYIIGTNSGVFEWSPRPLVRTRRTRRSKFERYSPENQFDLRIAQSWIMRRVIDMGWTTEMFGDFDRSAVFGRVGRESHGFGRIVLVAAYRLRRLGCRTFRYRLGEKRRRPW